MRCQNIPLSKIAATGILLFSTILMLPACGGQTTKSESEIEADFPIESRTITVDGREIVLDVAEFVVDRRRVNEEAETESVYCTVTLQNTDYILKTQFQMEYLYYEKGGWILDAVGHSSVEDCMLQVRNGVPHEVVAPYLTSYSSYERTQTYAVGETDAYNLYQVTGTAKLSGDQTTEFPYGGTVLLHGRLSQKEWDEYEWRVTMDEQQLQPAEGIPNELALLTAQEYYPSAQIVTDEFDPVSGGHRYRFSVNEEHPYCIAGGPLYLEYQFSYFDVDLDGYITPHWDLTVNRSELDTQWNLAGTWSGEFFKESAIGPYYDWYCPISFTIDSVTPEGVALTGGTCKITNILDIKTGLLPYKTLDDGSIEFELEVPGGYIIRVNAAPDHVLGIFPWLSYAKTDLIRQ